MPADQDLTHRYLVHGLPLELSCEIDWLRPPLTHQFEMFAAQIDAPESTLLRGSITTYRESDVAPIVSSSATRIPWRHAAIELYVDDEHLYLIDDRWGMANINFRKGRWQSWIVAQPLIDPIRCAELAVLWPLAQLARARGVHLLPATSITRGDHSMLVLSPFSIESELNLLLNAGYRLIGQSWTALRETSRGVELLHLPGQVERCAPPQMRLAGDARSVWIDLADARGRSSVRRATCDSVLIVTPARRPSAHLRPLHARFALTAVRAAWPIPQLHPHRRHGQLPRRLVQHCSCFETCLSRRPTDLLKLLSVLPARHTSVKSSTFPIAQRVAV